MDFPVIQWFAFVVITVALMFISRAALRAKGSHGFYRFFAWECILALFLLNAPVWFQDPLAWHQVISWILLIGSLIPLGLGVQALARRGRPQKYRSGQPELLAFEKTSILVIDGVYHYIRHPLYSSLLLLAWGVFFKLPSWHGGLMVLAASAFLWLTAHADETECLRFFGAEYSEYMKTTKRFIPFLF